MRILLTGSTGFLGSLLLRLLVDRGDTVYALYHKKKPALGIPLQGDVTLPNLGLEEVPDLDAVFHTAALVDLGERHKEKVWDTNVNGMHRVLSFCSNHHIERIFFTSTAYTQGRNTYERSKQRCEEMIKEEVEAQKLKATIFKISIIAGSQEGFAVDGATGFYDVVRVIARVHRRAEAVRKRFEGTLHLPPLELSVRLKGDPEAEINLVPVDWVAKSILDLIEREGAFWITGSRPPILKDLAKWVGEALYLNIKIEPDFTPTPVEGILARLVSPFLAYLKVSDPFESSVDGCPPITREFVYETVTRSLL